MLRFADAAVAVVSTLADQQERERQAASANATPRSEMQDAAWVTSVTDWMDLSHFNAEQQTTIRNFLQYVGMASLADEHDSRTGSRDGVDIIPQVGLHRSGSGQEDRAQSQSQSQGSRSQSSSPSQTRAQNLSGSSATNVSEAVRRAADGNVSIETGSNGLFRTREAALQDSMMAMEVPFVEDRESEEGMHIVLG